MTLERIVTKHRTLTACAAVALALGFAPAASAQQHCDRCAKPAATASFGATAPAVATFAVGQPVDSHHSAGVTIVSPGVAYTAPALGHGTVGYSHPAVNQVVYPSTAVFGAVARPVYSTVTVGARSKGCRCR